MTTTSPASPALPEVVLVGRSAWTDDSGNARSRDELEIRSGLAVSMLAAARRAVQT